MFYSGIERQITSMKIKRETQESPIIISRKIDVSAQQSKTTINNSIVNVRHINILSNVFIKYKFIFNY